MNKVSKDEKRNATLTFIIERGVSRGERDALKSEQIDLIDNVIGNKKTLRKERMD